ncbi:MAG TPA: SRPBCC family protein [Streptosporangiaceae bacterium]|jgi:uncharacterized protein YndB with AHSA1/START domain
MTEDLIGTLRPDGDRLAIRLERSYKTDAADLWSALTDPARLSRWFARVDGDLRVGGTFCIYFDDEDADQRSLGQVQECDPPHRLTVTWYFREEGESVVRAELAERPDGTQLTLEHRRMPRGQAAGYSAGWQTYTEQLAAYLIGDPGRGGHWDQRWEQLMPGYRTQLAALGQ